MAEATSTGVEAAPTGSVATATMADFTATGGKFTLTGCYAGTFTFVNYTLISDASTNRHELTVKAQKI